MSIICFKPKDVQIPKEALLKCFHSNFDGVGYSYCLNEIIITKRGFKSFGALFDSLSEVENLPCLITLIDKEIYSEKKYFQPFKIDDNFVVAYTGCLFLRNKLESPGHSQGYNFTQLFKSFWNPDLFNQLYFVSLMDDALSKTNSGCAIIMNNRGEIDIFNQKRGTTLAKCWFSENPYTISHFNSHETHTRYSYNTTTNQCCHCHTYYTISSLKLNLGKYYCHSCFVKLNNPILPPRPNFTAPSPIKLISTKNKNNSFLERIINPDLVNVMDLI